LDVRPARRRRFGADHRGVAGERLIVTEMRRGALSPGCARPGELRQRGSGDDRERARQDLLASEIFSHIEFLS
jgi:hypothetical protein